LGVTTAQTLSAQSRIRRIITTTLIGLARVTGIVNRTQTGVARIHATVNRTLSGVARIKLASYAPVGQILFSLETTGAGLLDVNAGLAGMDMPGGRQLFRVNKGSARLHVPKNKTKIDVAGN
jgi:hypothetical protein